MYKLIDILLKENINEINPLTSFGDYKHIKNQRAYDDDIDVYQVD
jgi:hypothetical protein